MQALKKKDIKLRTKLFKLEKQKKINKLLFIFFLSKNKKNKNLNKIKINLLKLQLKLHFYSKIQIKNRCILTNRAKSVDKKYSVSRIILRDFFQFGIIPGYKKAAW